MKYVKCKLICIQAIPAYWHIRMLPGRTVPAAPQHADRLDAFSCVLLCSLGLHALAVASKRTFLSDFLRGPRFHRRENGICVPCWWSRRFLNTCTKTWIQRQIQNSFVLSSVPRSEEHPHEQKLSSGCREAVPSSLRRENMPPYQLHVHRQQEL